MQPRKGMTVANMQQQQQQQHQPTPGHQQKFAFPSFEVDDVHRYGTIKPPHDHAQLYSSIDQLIQQQQYQPTPGHELEFYQMHYQRDNLRIQHELAKNQQMLQYLHLLRSQQMMLAKEKINPFHERQYCVSITPDADNNEHRFKFDGPAMLTINSSSDDVSMAQNFETLSINTEWDNKEVRHSHMFIPLLSLPSLAVTSVLFCFFNHSFLHRILSPPLLPTVKTHSIHLSQQSQKIF
jgi:hypothetical protein